MTADLSRLTSALADRYRIERELGQGGMATVYLAEDLRHDRKVALKVLRPELAAVIGAARFLQEIKTTANLQHPHILTLHDSGEVEGTVFYVMPFIQGESLRERLTREKQLPVEDAVRISREVASALDYAHRQGVIHRDIKPENILLHDGAALVADFGIALAASKTGAGRMTETGMSLGTPHYMSPEQAMGERELDARSDVYALGCVTYEMLSGEPPFTGPTAQAIIARVVTEEPRSLTLQRRSIPPHVEAAVVQALSKLPADRFSSAAQFAEALGNPSLARQVTRTTATTPAIARRGAATWAPWGALALAALLGLWGWLRPRPQPPVPPVTRFSIEYGGAGRIGDAAGSPIAVSSDGSRIVYVGQDEAGRSALYSRSLDREDPVLIAGTSNAIAPFFSPDGTNLGFVQDGRLRRVSLAGGAVTNIAETGSNGVTWAPGDVIYFVSGRGLSRVNSAGGTPEVLATPDSTKGESYRWPDAMPDGKSVLVTLVRGATPSLAAFTVPDGKLHELGQGGMYPRWVEGGFIAFVQTDGTLFAARYDPDAFRLTSAPVPIASQVRFGPAFPGKLGMSRTGTVAYLGGQNALREVIVVERDRGTATPIAVPSRFYASPRFSPDGQRLSFQVVDLGAGSFVSDLWTFDIRGGSLSRVTFDSGSANGEWLDARQLVYTRAGRVFRIATDGSGVPESLLAFPGRSIGEIQPSRDGKTLILRDNPTNRPNRDVWLASLGGVDSARALLRTPFDERNLALSPDGKWLAYLSNESGSDEVYLRKVEAGSGRWLVSRGGGREPRWEPLGRGILFRMRDSVMSAAVELSAAGEPRIGPLRVVFTGDFSTDPNRPNWDVSPDGKRFVFTRDAGGQESRRMNVVLNWFRH